MPLLKVEDLNVRYGSIQGTAGLSFEVNAGEIVALIGSNGAGKSSLFRVLGGLWPLAKGKIGKPGVDVAGGLSHDIFYVPQRPYVSVGTLQEQLIYPLPVDGTKTIICAHFYLRSLTFRPF